MSKVIITEQYLTDIADAIREKLGVNETYKPSEMGPAIKNIDYKTLLIDNPEYFINETIDTAKKINALRNEHTFITYFITDTHAHTSSNNMQYVDAQLASMHAIAKVIKPDLVIHGGDLVNGSEPKDTTVNEIKHIIKQMRDIGGNDTHILMGNHDGNTYAGSTQEEIESNRITENEMLTLSRAWDDGFTYAGNEYQGGNFYGYRDYSTLNLRIIRLHSYRENINNADYNGGKGQNWGYYEDEQTWFKNVALNTNNDILIFCHQSLAPVLQGFSDAQDIPHGGTIMQQALDTWLEADSNHRCIGVIHGHVHWDYSAKGKGTFNVIDHETKETITRIGNHGNFYEYGLCLANYLPSYSTTDITPISGYRDVPIGAIQRGRAVGTKTQGLWTAIVVDTNAETINFIRFGAGIDQAYSYSAPKINQLPLATDTDNTIYNSIGYKENTRLNSSGNAVAATGYYTTGFIPITSGKLVTFENIQLDADNSISGYNMQYITFYDSTKTLLANCSLYAYDWINSYGTTLMQPYALDGTNLISITPHGSNSSHDLTNIAYMRISAKLIDSTSAIYIGSYNESTKPSNNEDIDNIIPQVDIPTYIKNAALEIAHKVSAVQNDSTITFISMSDAHNLLSNNDIRTGIKHAGMAAKAISYMVPLDFFFHGGDATMGSSTTTIADGKAELAEVNYWIDEAAEGVPNFRVPGNHDALRQNTNVTPLTDAELYEFFGKYNDDGITVMGSATAGYCYRDFAEKKVRIICLNTAESAKENVSTMQQLWFCRTLASVPNDYGVVILSHHPLDWGNINPCANILYQFYEKGNYTVDGTTVSFESVNPAYTVCFHGHIHNFLADQMNRVVNSEGIPFNVQRIAVPNICFNRNNEYWQNGAPEYYGIEYGQPTTYNKTADTVNDTAFTVNVIDPLNEIVYSYCYGAGIDRVVGIGATVYHMVNTNLTHITNSNTNSIIENNTAYITTLTADSGYDIQSVTVTMGNTDITSTVYDNSTGIINIASVTDTITITAIAIIHTDYTNLVPTAVDSSGNVVGYKDGYYVSGSGKVGDFSANASFVATGAMALPSGWQYIYVKGVPMLSGDSHERYYFGKADKTVYDSGGYLNSTNYSSWGMTIETLDTNYYRISSTNTNTKSASFVAMSFKATDGANLIVTADEPIEQKEVIPDSDNQGEEVIFDDRNQYVIDFLSASSNYTQNNRSNITVIDNYANKNINDQDAPQSFLGKYNLIPGIKNTVNGWTITRLPEPPRMLKLENVWNIRDIGGWPCDGGTVKFNKIFRGARLNNVSASSTDATTLAEFGIKLDLDIRDSGNATGNTPIPNCTYRNVPIVNAYAQMLSDEPAAAAEACQVAMQSVVDGNPVYIHCASGSDRTGCICAMLEALLGVSDRDIDRDYELTNFSDYEDLTGRKRNGGSWTGFMNAIAAYGADSTKMNVMTFLQQYGVTAELINAFRVAAIDSNSSSITSPSYWKSTLADKAATIRGRDGYQFAYFTDVHWEDNNKQSPALIQQLMIDTGTDCCVCGGDLIVQQPTKANALAMLTEVRDVYDDLNVAYCVGNHDLNSAENSDSSVYLTEAEWRGIFDTEHTGVTYYTHPDSGDLTAFGYRDHPESKIREIFVNTGGMTYTSENNAHWAAAMIWACQRITELSSDWGVLIFAHIWWAPTGHMVKQAIATTIENYISQYASSRKAELIAIITGHTHDDYHDYNATDGYLITSTTTDSGSEQASIDEVNPTRTPGTTLEQAFDVITVDRTNKMLYFDRIGAGSSRALLYYQQPTYTVTYSLTDVASSNSATSAQGGTSYTTTLTAASGKEISTITVTMGGTDVTSTTYNGTTGVVSITNVTGNVTITASAASSKPTWTNLVPSALSTSGAVYNDVGYKDGKYLSNTTATLEGGNDANFTLTGRIPYSQADFAAGKVIYISGINWTTDDHCRFIFLETLTSAASTPYCKGSNSTSGAAQNIRTYFTLTEYSDYWTLTPIAGTVTNTALTYIAFSLKGAGANLSIGVIESSSVGYTNIVDTYGYTDGKYISSGNLSTNAADTTIGKIPLTALPSGSVLYIKGYTGATSASHTRINISSNASYGSGHISEKNGWLASPINPLTVEILDTNYYKVTVNSNWSNYYTNAAYLGLCFADTKGADLIITINEPIDENIVELVNQLPLATDTDGTVYNGMGYKENTRLNSSGNITTTNGIYATGFIPIIAGQTVTFKNIQLDADNSITDYSLQYITFYDSNKTLLANCSMYARNWIVDQPALVQPYTLDGTNLISITPHGTQGTRDLTNVAFMRISAKLIDGTSAIYVE